MNNLVSSRNANLFDNDVSFYRKYHYGIIANRGSVIHRKMLARNSDIYMLRVAQLSKTGCVK